MATSPIASSPLAEAVKAGKLRSCGSDSNLLSKLNKNSQLKRVRRETEHSCSSSSSTCDLSTASKKDQRQSFGFVPITQHDDEMLESGGMFELEVSW